MAKAHEEQWEVYEDDGRGVITALGNAVAEAFSGDRIGHAERLETARLIAAAPALAQALLGVGWFAVDPNGDADVWHTEACWQTNRAICTPDCQRAVDALRKAGVR